VKAPMRSLRLPCWRPLPRPHSHTNPQGIKMLSQLHMMAVRCCICSHLWCWQPWVREPWGLRRVLPVA